MRYAILLALPIVMSQAPETKLDGEWRCVGLVIDGGKKQPRSAYSKIWLLVDGESWREEANGMEMQAFKLLPDGVVRMAAKDVSFLGRYEVKDGKFRVCYPGPLEVGKPPRAPEKIESKAGSLVAEWVRVKK
jgi:hypothetical protein